MSLLQEKRLAKGLSVQETAQALGVSTDDVRRWEAGELPDAKVLLPLSDLFGVAVEDILRGSEGARATMPECGAFSAEEGEELSRKAPPTVRRPQRTDRSTCPGRGATAFRVESVSSGLSCARRSYSPLPSLFLHSFLRGSAASAR